MDRDELADKANLAVEKAETSLNKAADRPEKEADIKNQQLEGRAREEGDRVREAMSRAADRLDSKRSMPAEHYDDVLYQEDDEWVDKDERTTQPA